MCCRYTRADPPGPGRAPGSASQCARCGPCACTGARRVGTYAHVAYGDVTRPPGPRGPHPTLRTAMTPPAGPAAVPVALAPDSARAAEAAAATEPKRRGEQVALVLVIAIPFLALVAAIPVAWGWGLSWLDVVLAVADLRGHRARHHGRLPPATSPTARSRPTAGCGSRWRSPARMAIEGAGDPLGRRPPPAPRVHRPRGRPALAVALRRDRAGADQGPVLRPHGLAVRRRADQPQRSSPPTCWRTATSCGSPRPFPLLVAGLAAAAGRCSAGCSPGPGRAR